MLALKPPGNISSEKLALFVEFSLFEAFFVLLLSLRCAVKYPVGN